MNMKTVCFLFAVFGFGALSLGSAFAGQPSKPEPSKYHITGDDRLAPPSHGKPEHVKTDLATGNLPKPQNSSLAPKTTTHAAPTDSGPKGALANALSQPGLNKAKVNAAATVTPKGGLAANKPASQHVALATLPANIRPAVPSSGVPRGHSPAPAVIGGLASSSIKSSGAVLTGTGMKRKL
jgi:hypothetical protein